MGKRATFTQAEVTRAVKGAQAGGMKIKRVEILPDGRIVVSIDEELNLPTDAEDAFGAWKARREGNS
jgi:hypothetical protein